jgi:SAM-dependent methyltransferase
MVTAMKDLLQPAHSTQRLRALLQRLRPSGSFTESGSYWEQRYLRGGTSGEGSYGALGAAKATFLNEFVREHGVQSVIELGCGDGNQLSLASYPSYIGLDVSRTAIKMCKRRFASDLTKTFFLYDSSRIAENRHLLPADLALSLDVIYHLVEDAIFETYMDHLFGLGRRYIVVHSTNAALSDEGLHVRHRQFSPWVEKNCQQWRLAQVTRGSALADFFVYERIAESAGC